MITNKYVSELGKLIFIEDVEEYKKILYIENRKGFSEPNEDNEKKEENRKDEEEMISFFKDQVRNISYFHHNYSGFSGLCDLNYFYLLSFINTDFEVIQNHFNKISNQLLENNFSNDFSILVQELYNHLVKCHPFFKYDAYEFICHTLIANYINHCTEHEISTFTKDSFEKAIETICSLIIDLIPSIPPNSLDDSVEDFIHYFYPTHKRMYSWMKSKIVSPLADVIEFQKFIIENIPHVTYVANDNMWKDFLNELTNQFGNIEKSSVLYDFSYDDPIEQALQRVLKKSYPLLKNTYFEPKSWYKVHSFQQYIVTLLNTFKTSKCAIKFCHICDMHYITPMNSNEINHDKCEENHPNYKRIKAIKKSAYNRIYQRAYNRKETYLLETTGFMHFHKQTFHLVLKHKLSSEVYESFTKQTFYNYNDFQNLGSIIDYNNALNK